ncbi:MAG: prepilin-type N-terminal cleavage/methylation domain-containing protein [Candidatus Omnitrophota bacterium]
MKKSFTLIELIVVIAIIAILAAIIAPNAFKAIEKAKITQAMADAKAYKTATFALYVDTGHWVIERGASVPPAGPIITVESDNNDLSVNFNNYAGWDGPYIENIKSKHPWGGWYVFQLNNVTQGPGDDIWVDWEDACYPEDTATNQECPMPEASAQAIDDKIDDGDLTNGTVTRGIGGSPADTSWFIVLDI